LLLTRILLLLLVAACGDGMKPPPPKCAAGFIGDPGLAPRAEIVWTDGISQMLAEVQDGQAIPLEPPPQGGYVIYAGAKVQNMLACVELRGRLRDATTLEEYGFDARSTTLKLQSDGWGWPDATLIGDVSNVNPCPDYKSQDVTGRSYQLEMVVVDKDGRQVEAVQPVVPTCMLSDPAVQKDCVCTCTANYTLGRCNPLVDGGTTD
jgi:hypothetical protein